jgi:hypothetical protein
MSQLQPYAGAELDGRTLIASEESALSEDAVRLHQAEAELERLRGIVKHQAQALKIAGKVLAPYLTRYG